MVKNDIPITSSVFVVPLPPPPPPVPSGPTVDPLILTYIPVDVVQISPFVGDVGAVPCGSLAEDIDVVAAGKTSVPVIVLPASRTASFEISAFTNAVVAICVVFVPVLAVGASGVPVKVGDASLAIAESIYVAEIDDPFHIPDVIVPTTVADAAFTALVVTISVLVLARVFGRIIPSDPVSTK